MGDKHRDSNTVILSSNKRDTCTHTRDVDMVKNAEDKLDTEKTWWWVRDKAGVKKEESLPCFIKAASSNSSAHRASSSCMPRCIVCD